MPKPQPRLQRPEEDNQEPISTVTEVPESKRMIPGRLSVKERKRRFIALTISAQQQQQTESTYKPLIINPSQKKQQYNRLVTIFQNIKRKPIRASEKEICV